MTLLEALAALVILGTSAVGFLEVFHTTARVTRDAAEWSAVTACAESVMERTKIEGTTPDAIAGIPSGLTARVEERAWAPGLTEVVVVVTSSSGRNLELRRLAPDGSRRPAGRVR